MEEFARSDAFFDALMLGDDPSAGTDPLAAALLDLKADVDRPMPPAPQLFTENPQPSGNVASLEEKRAKKAKRRVSPWLSGLIGAAAATVVCVGTGAVLFESDTTDEDTTVVELATTLDELEVASESGDAAAARDLLEQARDLVATIQERERRAGASATVTETKTVTEASTVPPEGASSERPAPEQVPAPPVQQPTQAPQDPAQRGPGAGNGAGTGHGRPTQSTQPTSSSPQPSTTAGSAAPSQGQDAASESPSSEAGAEQESPSLRVNDPATMVSPPAEFGAGASGGA